MTEEGSIILITSRVRDEYLVSDYLAVTRHKYKCILSTFLPHRIIFGSF
jgi:hypothetical protein